MSTTNSPFPYGARSPEEHFPNHIKIEEFQGKTSSSYSMSTKQEPQAMSAHKSTHNVVTEFHPSKEIDMPRIKTAE